MNIAAFSYPSTDFAHTLAKNGARAFDEDPTHIMNPNKRETYKQKGEKNQ